MDVLRNTAVDHRGGLAAATCIRDGEFCLTRAADPVPLGWDDEITENPDLGAVEIWEM
jgi:hypothetical protein